MDILVIFCYGFLVRFPCGQRAHIISFSRNPGKYSSCTCKEYLLRGRCMQYPRGQIRLRLCHFVVDIFDIFVDVYFACLSCCWRSYGQVSYYDCIFASLFSQFLLYIFWSSVITINYNVFSLLGRLIILPCVSLLQRYFLPYCLFVSYKDTNFLLVIVGDLSLMKVVDNESLKVKRNKCPKCRDTEKMKVKGERKNM